MSVDALPDVGGVRVLRARGELDVHSVTPLMAHLDQWVSSARGVVLDLTEVEFFDSYGVHLVDALARRSAAEGAAFRLVAAPGTMVRRVLEIVGLAGDVLPDREAAMAAVQPD
jgi:anti-anti-sigma factor